MVMSVVILPVGYRLPYLIEGWDGVQGGVGKEELQVSLDVIILTLEVAIPWSVIACHGMVMQKRMRRARIDAKSGGKMSGSREQARATEWPRDCAQFYADSTTSSAFVFAFLLPRRFNCRWVTSYHIARVNSISGTPSTTTIQDWREIENFPPFPESNYKRFTPSTVF
ncbi:hypothetical protein BO70DRAFT_352156 [Aspergillus heteromorphus CBS 117.55]|uniref:Uncharacterized protein n=1 Tax=Aspergillus heteromorphus CBS 117.55 TaxID=1448321 RepID=A0A317WIE5_9EURO|nr:uncharacterized protein BO70DRAFT_352156 [Aspergillus heteromorphus CBS 117.55]PWY85052.1 hypothetical protein BO70DRAFT_352156 [Aspergillus heteromorphus CBS 117.55]